MVQADALVAAAPGYSMFVLRDLAIFYFRSFIFPLNLSLVSNTYDIFLVSGFPFLLLAISN
jgi:hypothetical protein